MFVFPLNPRKIIRQKVLISVEFLSWGESSVVTCSV